ncbi:hypothetical protein TSUD_235540 [Trifolium subterraneum]|nr:hypothetical protein TSUD_235540 [Trifolium subterraneum]
MKLSQALVRKPFTTTSLTSSSEASVSSSATNPVSPLVASNSGFDSVVSHQEMPGKLEGIEEGIERMIYRCRFLAILGVFGSLIGSILCFIKSHRLSEFLTNSILVNVDSCVILANEIAFRVELGLRPNSRPYSKKASKMEDRSQASLILDDAGGSSYVAVSFVEYFVLVNRSKVIQLLIEALDVYLLGTVMLVFGMGLYELFVSNLDSASSLPDQNPSDRSNLFGLFTLKERPKWLNIKTVNELKTKVGHVIVMLLIIGLFDRSKKATIQTPVDLLCFCASVFLSSSCLFLLSKLNESN